MWASHLRTSLRLGLVPDDFAAIRRGPEAPHWSPAERTILATINELRDHAALCDASWAALRGVLDERQAMDFLFTVGTYLSLAMVFNTLRIARELELLELAQRSEEHTSELQSLMRISYAVFCLKKKKKN